MIVLKSLLRSTVCAALCATLCATLAGQAIAQTTAPAPRFGPATGAPFKASFPIAIIGGTLIDGNGGAPQTGMTVVIQGDRILSVGPSETAKIPEGAQRIDATGMTVMPGLINSNQHIQLNPIFPAPAAELPLDQIKARWEANFERMPQKAYTYLMQGITTMRQTSGPFKRILPVKQRIDAGEIPGPRIELGGALIMSPQFFQSYIHESKTPADAVSWMHDDFAYFVLDDIDRDLARISGPEFTYWKLYLADEPFNGKNDFTDAQIRYIIAKAHKLGKKIDIHGHASNDGLRRLLKFDIDTLEHPFYGDFDIDQDIADGYAKKGILATSLLRVMVTGAEMAADPHRFDESIYAMSMAPEEYRTLLAYRDKMIANKADPSKPGIGIYDRTAKHADMGASTALENKGMSFDDQQKRRDTSRRNMQKFIKAGVKLTMGTDTPSFLNFIQEDPNAREMMNMVELGMTPMQTIIASTRNGAEALGMLKDLGTIEKGKIADVIVVAGDPLKDMAAMKRVAIVVKDGVRFK